MAFSELLPRRERLAEVVRGCAYGVLLATSVALSGSRGAWTLMLIPVIMAMGWWYARLLGGILAWAVLFVSMLEYHAVSHAVLGVLMLVVVTMPNRLIRFVLLERDQD